MKKRNVATETDWNDAPSVMESIEETHLSPEYCNLTYWYQNVASVAADLVNGHKADVNTPKYMYQEGGFKDALLREFAFRAIAEEKAAKAIGYIVASAPNSSELNFYATQLVDEARHAEAFKAHIGEIVGDRNVETTVKKYSSEGCRTVLDPLEEYALAEIHSGSTYIVGVAMLTIIVEGVLAPTGELSERKWAIIDPAAASVERGASIDEVRHLAVGSEIIRAAVSHSPDVVAEVKGVVERGLQYWMSLPIMDEMQVREQSFQEGLSTASDFLLDSLSAYECWPGTRLLDTGPTERIAKAMEWSLHAQSTRMKYMGMSNENISLV